jgi:hypothetical protein
MTTPNLPTTRKPHRDLVGYVAERRNPLTGGHIIILDCRRAEEEGRALVDNWQEEGGRYQVLCDTHATCVHTSNLPSARETMKDATNFCDECRSLAEALSTPAQILEFVRKKVAVSPRCQPWKEVWRLHSLGSRGLLPSFALANQTCVYLDRAYGRLLPNHIGNLRQDQRLVVIDEAIQLAKKDQK